MANEKRSGGGNGLVVGLLLGILVGVILALFFAPETGEKTRDNLNRANLRQHYDEAMRQGREAYQQARSEVVAKVKE